MYRLLPVIFTTFLFIGCSPKEHVLQQKKIETTQKPIEYLYDIPQEPSLYSSNIPLVEHNTLEEKDRFFNKRYFKPWHIPQVSPTKEEAMWGFAYQHRKTFGMNYQALDFDWYEQHKTNANFKQYNTLKRKGIVIKNTNLRVLPTNQPIFLDPTQAGEGFPFDYNQVSSIYINTPIIISHLSLDKGWALIESNFTTGWIPIDAIAYLDKKRRETFENNQYAVAVKDNFPLYSDGEFIDYIKLGTIFPQYQKQLFIVRRDTGLDGKLILVTTKHIQPKPLRFEQENIINALNELKNEPYGWGGLYNTRDCSSMTKDLFSLFGIYLERNSYGQTFNGKYISFNNLNNEQKKQTILEKATPFETLIYLKGHIMLYVGNLDNEPILFHQFWGIQTKDQEGNEGRAIIGRAIFSTLDLGKSIPDFDPEASLLSKARGMIILNFL